ncbi:MAG: hypothetical protein U5R14_00815 [Gemmatimonadota bacterium]|nr:hypothetical protein [Gemmatimonadota bacterium]
MEQLPLLLNIVGVGLWLGFTVDFLRRPPLQPRSWGRNVRRGAWVGLAMLFLAAGGWGPEMSHSTTSDFSRDPDVGTPVETTSSLLRTPFAIYESTAVMDREGRTIRQDRMVTRQLPLALLIFLAGAFWLRRRRELSEKRSPTSRGATDALALVGILSATLTGAGCGDPAPWDGDRPERKIVDVTWDTLAHVRSGVNDSLLFSASGVAADEEGFWVGDLYGDRVARFDWEGRLLRYVGDSGRGPGEIGRVHEIDVDGEGVLWILDPENTRITGFDQSGALVDEVPFRGLDASPGSFAVSRDGRTFMSMLPSDRLEPILIHRDGRIERGTQIPVPDANGAFGLALQGRVARHDHGWLFAFTSGDGIFRMRGLETVGPRLRYPEAIPFPGITRSVQRDGRRTSTTTRLAERNPAAAAISTRGSELLVVFHGESPNAGRLLDRYDLERGRYLDTVLLPVSGYVAAWDDRLVVARTNPRPELLVLRQVE